ncbi:hypothetical protein CNR22_05705 [Sphingobacteriaceae bacterium]|nr:hypothetical protein CNR22_05705 [Sphingobacteriaceae bacterium]
MKKIYLTLTLLACLFFTRSFSQCATATTVPYHENFSGFTANNQLPACWAISNPTTCVTYSLGNGSAGFLDGPVGTSYFYSRAVNLNAGVTYSASLWHKVSSASSNSWSDLSIMLGTSQTSSGLVSLASVNFPASPAYVALSNTFAVASSGTYYFAIRGISINNSFSNPSLTWDDFDVSIPCTSAGNSPSLTIVTATNTLCNGQTYSATVSGADTYSWSNGSTASSFTAMPNQNMQYYVIGTNMLSGCSATLNAPYVTLLPAPGIVVVGDNSVCLGANIGLQANGATSYSWNTGATSAAITVTPAVTTIYTVTGTNSSGCSSIANYTVTVNPLPVFTYSASKSLSTLCRFDVITFTASSAGSLSYTWSTSQGNASGTLYTYTAAISNSINLIGMGSDGCKKTTAIFFSSDNCSGLTSNSSASMFKVYPNPGSGVYTFESENSEMKFVEVIDLSGRIILSTQTTSKKLKIDLKEFSAGVYYAKINSAGKTETLKLIKE